jgi:hypothetical protein
MLFLKLTREPFADGKYAAYCVTATEVPGQYCVECQLWRPRNGLILAFIASRHWWNVTPDYTIIPFRKSRRVVLDSSDEDQGSINLGVPVG